MNLVKLAGDVFYIPGRTNVGVVVRDDWCILVASGLGDDSARKALRAVEGMGLRVRYLVNTHSHADHIGGNRFIVKRSGAMVLAPEVEADFVEHPILEPLTLYGAYPPIEMRGRFTMAKPTKVSRTFSEGVDEELGLEYVALPGHSINLHGVAASGVLFLGDALFPENLMEKYGVIYHLNVGEAVKSMEKLRETRYKLYVPSHAPHTSNVNELVERNIHHVEKVRDKVLEVLDRSRSLEEIVSEVLEAMDIEVSTLPLYYLYNSTIKSYLTWLCDDGVIKCVVKGGKVSYVLP